MSQDPQMEKYSKTSENQDLKFNDHWLELIVAGDNCLKLVFVTDNLCGLYKCFKGWQLHAFSP